jgi:PKD repeat protein
MLSKNVCCFLIGGFVLLAICGLSFGQADQPLVAIIDASPISGPAPLSVVFDASRSTGDIMTAYWEFGDGGYAYGKRVVHTYNVQGTYVATLTVYDPAGNSAFASVTITVLQPAGQPPILTLYDPQINGLTVTINGVTQPGTPGTTITRIHWIWGDGSEGDYWFPASHTYREAGRYRIIVISFQSDGLSTASSVTVTLSEPRPSQPPSLDLFTPEIQGLTVRINGVALPGTPGTVISRIHWDWGDGSRGDQWFAASHTYASPGTYTVTVTAFQSDGLSTTRTVTVRLAGSQPPSQDSIFRGIILVDRPIISFYSFDISIQTILSDPSGKLRVGDVITVGGHRDSPAKVDLVAVGDLVEVKGVVVSGPEGYGVQLTEARHYVKRIGTQGNLAYFDLDYRGSPPNSDGNEQRSITAQPGAPLTLFFRYNEGNVGNQYVVRVYAEWDRTRPIANSDNDETISEVGAEIGGYRWDKEAYTAPSTPGTYKVRVVYSASATPPTWDRYDRLLAEGSITVQALEKPRPPYYLLPPYLNLTVSETSSIQLRVIDRNGNIVSEGITFEYDRSFISVSADGLVTALREEQPGEAGTTVGASVNGVPVSSRTVIRVLSTNYRIPYRWLVGNHVAWYFPEEIKGENLSHFVEQYEILRASDIAYEIQAGLIKTQPFNSARQIFEVEIQEDGKVCGVAGNPIRLGWTITGNEWANCFLVPLIQPRSPHWGVFFHELGHNFTLASESFQKALNSKWVYQEAIATAISFTTLRLLLNGSYSLSPVTVSSLEIIVRDEQRMLDEFQKWLQAGADFKVLEQVPGPGPDIVDGIWLYYRNQRPLDFAERFFTLLRPQYYSILEPILNKMRPGDEHTMFAALVSAALGQDLSLTFLQDYHYPLNRGLFNEAYHVFLTILGSYSR